MKTIHLLLIAALTLLALPALAANFISVDKQTPAAVKTEKPIKTVRLSKSPQKPKPQVTSKHKHQQKSKPKKKVSHHLKAKKQKTKVHKQAPKKKTTLLKKNKPLVKHHPQPTGKPQTESLNQSKESVDQMTNAFLKTALIENKTIPEE